MTRFYWPIAKVAAEQRMVWGYASTEAEDDQGETVTRAALAAALDDYMRFANIREMHQPSAVGVAKQAEIDDKGLYLGAKIIDSDAWQKVIEGVYKGFSIGGRVTARDPADRRLITALQLTEISVVDRPANPDAVFDCWKRSAAAAAAGHEHNETTPAGDDVGMPVAGSDPHGRLDYADPGYQTDGRPRYPLDSERHIRAAWAYIHQSANAARYSAAQLEHLKQRILAAWRTKIDAQGPAAAGHEAGRGRGAVRKGLGAIAMLAQIIEELEALRDRLGVEAAIEGDASPLPDRLRAIIGELRELLCAAVAEEAGEGDSDDDAAPRLAAMALAGTLRKARQPDFAALVGGLAKLSSEIVPRLDALQKRVEEIAQTPLPPRTVTRGFVGIAKRDDGGAATPPEDIVAALTRMSEEERTLTLIKAAHQSPIVPLPRPPGSIHR
jgi:HK97 family phage prohead protease